MPIYFEIKAKCRDLNKVRDILKSQNAEFKAIDHQIDTYFHSKNGILKFREANLENNLIHYLGENTQKSTKRASSLYKAEANSSLKDILEKSLGKKCVVEKNREIYLIDKVKFHLDTIKDLGNYIKIVATQNNNNTSTEELQEQCNFYIKLLQINAKDLISDSYSDIIQQNNLFSQILFEE